MASARPLFRLDPGWLFTIAGLAIMVASALLPAQHDVAVLKEQLVRLQHEEKVNQRRLQAYERFLDELKSKDPSLLKRLAASQLNLMPEGEEPMLVATSMEHTVSDWIEATVPPEAFEPNLVPDTLLTRMAAGQRRLWLMGGGALIVFVGLITGIPLTHTTKIVATQQEKEWLEMAQARAEGNSAESRAAVAAVAPNHDEPPGHDAALSQQWQSALNAIAESELPADAPADHETAPAEPWRWNDSPSEDLYFVVSREESGDSMQGSATLDTGLTAEDAGPHAAD